LLLKLFQQQSSHLLLRGSQMEMIYTLIEAIVISFLVGAILGGVIAAHLQNKQAKPAIKTKVKDF